MRYTRWVAIFVPLLWMLACEREDLTMREKAASEARRAELLRQASEVLQGWLDQMVRTLPADLKKYPKVKSPLVDWRRETFEYDWRRPLQAVVVRARGTPFQKELESIPRFLDAMEAFWKKELDFKDYMAAWRELKAQLREDDPKTRLVHLLADFDHTFVHVEAFYGAQDMEGDDRAIYFFRHWQVAFEFPREHQEAVSDYLARLCKEKLADFCRSVPFEVLHFAMERPYLAEVQRITRAFTSRYPDCPLNRIFEPFLADVENRLHAIPEFREDPVLPDARSRAPFVGDVPITVTSRAIESGDQTLLVFGDGFRATASDWAAMARKVAAIQKVLEQERGPENLEVLLVAMDRTAPIGIATELVAIFRTQPARFITFGARRRADGIARRTVVGRFQFREVPVAPRRLDLPGVGRLACRPIGQWPDSNDLPSRVQTVVYLDPQRVLSGRLEAGRPAGVAEVDEAGAVNALRAGPGLLLVRADTAVERFLRVLEPLFVGCTDQACTAVREENPQIEVQGCVH